MTSPRLSHAVCLVVDARSIHAQRWAGHLARAGLRGTVLSSRRLTSSQRAAWASSCQAFRVLEPTDLWNRGRTVMLGGLENGVLRHVVTPLLSRTPLASPRRTPGATSAPGTTTTGRARDLEERLDLWAAARAARRLEKLCRRHRFALVHALRIPYEGIIAAIAELDIPMVVSTWGSDLKLQAHGRVESHARETLARCDGFMADSSADVAVAEAFGLSRSTPRLVVPGNMGLDLAVFQRLLAETGTGSATRPPVVVYPRGVSPYVDHETFLDAIPRVLERRSDARIVCLGLRRSQSAVRRAESLGSAVTVANFLPQEDLWRLYARASVVVSPALSDGMPNSVIEAAALGAIPVVSDLPWVGEAFAEPAHCYSVEHRKPEAMAQAIVQALAVPGAVRQRNIDTMAARFGAEQSLDLVMGFYAELVRLRHRRYLADWLAGTRGTRTSPIGQSPSPTPPCGCQT